ncbi:MAG: prepilin-type N-terminal cleavage/methylation domain-containing protein, partial [Nitrospinota bacterium]|nr:prepilin-type N-terminal cleavage/methylation domain-containing protein [Nitrospinota bacterium]
MAGRRPAASVAGFTMIELLIAMIMASVLMVSMVQMFRSNRIAFSLVDDIRGMEQNARIGMDFMSRDFRKAGMGAHQAIPFMPVDNTSTIWASRNAGLTTSGHPILAGTDLTEMFWGYLPIPICVEVNGTGATGFSTNNANMKLPRISLMGLPDYSVNLSGTEAGELLSQYNVLIYDPICPTTVNCQQNLTNGGWNSASGQISVQLDYNRGNSNPDAANRPHSCMTFENSPVNDCPSGVACINIGEDMYYFVQDLEPGNPQLVRYNLGPGSFEVMSNYVEDFQLMYGVDGVTSTDVQDGMVGATEWLNGDQYNTNNSG